MENKLRDHREKLSALEDKVEEPRQELENAKKDEATRKTKIEIMQRETEVSGMWSVVSLSLLPSSLSFLSFSLLIPFSLSPSLLPVLPLFLLAHPRQHHSPWPSILSSFASFSPFSSILSCLSCLLSPPPLSLPPCPSPSMPFPYLLSFSSSFSSTLSCLSCLSLTFTPLFTLSPSLPPTLRVSREIWRSCRQRTP